jgi:hypothetical protein
MYMILQLMESIKEENKAVEANRECYSAKQVGAGEVSLRRVF